MANKTKNKKPLNRRAAEDFSATQKARILKRDEYKCVFCGLGEREGVKIDVYHIIPQCFGGKTTMRNGIVFCDQHKELRKMYIGLQAQLNKTPYSAS